MPGGDWENASIRSSVKERIEELVAMDECLYGSLGDFLNEACRRLIYEEEKRIAAVRSERKRQASESEDG